MILQVETNYGYVKGNQVKGHPEVVSFIGVPYACEYSRRFRFRSAKPAERWKGIKLCDGVQPEHIAVNIWTPALNKESGPLEQLPVVLFIPGFFGLRDDPINAAYNGAAFAESQHVVVCSIFYRTCAFGFLDLSGFDPKFESNIGLKDQLLAIQWVYENIEYFGGNKENITLAGSLEGGGDVMKLITLPAVKPYITRAFVTSPRYIDVTDREGALLDAKQFLKRINISEEKYETLLDIPADGITVPFVFHPVVDGVFITKDPAEAPSETNRTGNDIPLTIVLPKENDFRGKKAKNEPLSNEETDEEEKQALRRFMDSYGRSGALSVREFDYSSLYLIAKGRRFTTDLDTAMFFNNPDCAYVSSAVPLMYMRRRAVKLAESCSMELGEYLRGMSFTLK